MSSTSGGISTAAISRLTAPLRMAIAVAPTASRSSSWMSRGTSAASGAASTTARGVGHGRGGRPARSCGIGDRRHVDQHRADHDEEDGEDEELPRQAEAARGPARHGAPASPGSRRWSAGRPCASAEFPEELDDAAARQERRQTRAVEGVGDAAGDLRAARIGRHGSDLIASMPRPLAMASDHSAIMLAGVVADDAGAEDAAARR